ncbi:MAG TPA: GIY-YIG nuclease family protein [Candidatus Paceibacterota bacterium]|nr:GIY-YIG nuclease family protein [Candidatus Paceibacterota bacterium]
MYYVYILECADKSLYTGITTNVERRFNEHKNGTGSKSVRGKRAVKIVYTERKLNRSTASKREAAIKKLSRQEKLDLIKSA